MVRLLPAIQALWKSDTTSGSGNVKDRRVPLDDLHIAFFNKLIDILESSKRSRVVEVAIQLPKQLAGYRDAESAFYARLSLPRLIDQLENDRFTSAESFVAALDVITRIFRFSRNGLNIRTITKDDLRSTIPFLSEILPLSPSPEVTTSALAIVDEIYQLFDHAADSRRFSDWLEANVNLFADEQKGLLGVLLTQLPKDTVSDVEKTLVRQFACYLLSFQAVRAIGVSRLVSQGYLTFITFDMFSFSCQSDKEVDTTPVDLFNQVSQGGKFTDHLDVFIEAGSVEALAMYFSRANNPVPRVMVYAGLLRRLLRLVNGPHSSKIEETQVMEIMARRCPLLPHETRRNEDNQDLARQMELVNLYLHTRMLDPSLVPPVQLHPAVENEGIPGASPESESNEERRDLAGRGEPVRMDLRTGVPDPNSERPLQFYAESRGDGQILHESPVERAVDERDRDRDLESSAFVLRSPYEAEQR